MTGLAAVVIGSYVDAVNSVSTEAWWNQLGVTGKLRRCPL
jgi:hypothetical protein